MEWWAGGRREQIWPARGHATEVGVNVNANAHTTGAGIPLLSKEDTPEYGKRLVHRRRVRKTRWYKEGHCCTR